MSQEASIPPVLATKLRTLSFRDLIDVLLRAIHTLPHKNQAEILGRAGLHALTTRVLPIVLHFLFKRFVRDAFWLVMCALIGLACLVLLAWLEQTNPQAVIPVVVTVICFVGGVLVSIVFTIGRDMYLLLRRTTSKEERTQIVAMINELDLAERTQVLRALSIEVSRQGPGDTLRSMVVSFVTSGILLILLMMFIGFMVLLSKWAVLPASLLASIAAVFAFCGGFFVPLLTPHVLSARKR